jgi:glutamyl-tRNA synthetase
MAVTRLAPSPTGALHLGNARTFFINWILARQNGWRILLRIEDLDGPRIKAGSDRILLEDLAYLGLDWDVGPVYQSGRTAEYRRAVDRLVEQGSAYPCICTRREVDLAASAPHAEDGATVYPGICRGRFESIQQARQAASREPAIRFAAPDRIIEFHDRFLGAQQINVGKTLGDFVIAKSDGTAAYQLAVVVDDLAGGVSEVVRGDDLLDSTPRQILLYEALGAGDGVPHYTHVPLVIGSDGRRLAKRHGDTRIATYRQLGVPAARIVELLARWCGIENSSRPIEGFSLDRLGKGPIVFGPGDDAWLRQRTG